MDIQSPEKCDSTTDAEPTPGTNSTPPGLKSEGVPGPHTERPTGAQEASEPGAEPTEESSQPRGRRAALNRVRRFVTWAPKNCRYDPNEPPKFSLSLNLLFALVRFRLVPNATQANGVNFTHCPGRHDHRGELVLRPANLVQDCRYI